MAFFADSDDQPHAPRDPDADRDEAAQWHRLTGLGVEFVAALLVPCGIGWWLDGRFGTSPWLLIVGGAFGFAVGLTILVRAGMKSFHD